MTAMCRCPGSGFVAFEMVPGGWSYVVISFLCCDDCRTHRYGNCIKCHKAQGDHYDFAGKKYCITTAGKEDGWHSTWCCLCAKEHGWSEYDQKACAHCQVRASGPAAGTV